MSTTTGWNPWRRALLEVVVIVGSILLAFGMDRWWEGSREAAARARLSDDVATEFVQIIDVIDARIQAGETLRGRLVDFLLIDPDTAARVPTDSAYLMLQAIWRPGTDQINDAMVLDLLDAESFDLLANSALRSALAEWRSSYLLVESRLEVLDQLQVDALRELGKHQAIRTRMLRPASRTDSYPMESGAALRQALSDEGILGVASAKETTFRRLDSLLRRLRESSTEVHRLATSGH